MVEAGEAREAWRVAGLSGLPTLPLSPEQGFIPVLKKTHCYKHYCQFYYSYIQYKAPIPHLFLAEAGAVTRKSRDQNRELLIPAKARRPCVWVRRVRQRRYDVNLVHVFRHDGNTKASQLRGASSRDSVQCSYLWVSQDS
ncbi:hypothetical protein E2C01_077092 [Portunus trituberculatus]|uniref:Uncharacterized protein n=1 Tax=Portunus trituberculatus TaxID=210409 RepID=A0A5B7IQD8_PORTR|nr:hypothetical protein [Portunus trituberculatus]